MSDQLTNSITRLDPIDGERLISAWSGSDAKRALLQEIDTSDERVIARLPQGGRSRRALAVAGVLVVAAVSAVLTGVVPGTDNRAYAVRELPNGVIEIENVADIRDVRGLEAELREFGVDVEIVTETASPSLVGQAQANALGLGDRRLPGLEFGEDGTRDVFRWRIDPRVFHDKITITLFVQPREGESYLNSTAVFSPGEVLAGLHCALGEPVRAADVAERLPSLGITPIWTVHYPTDDPSIGRFERVDEVPTGEVLSGHAIDESTVEFDVVEDEVALPKSMREPMLSDAPCTKEQAARWR